MRSTLLFLGLVLVPILAQADPFVAAKEKIAIAEGSSSIQVLGHRLDQGISCYLNYKARPVDRELTPDIQLKIVNVGPVTRKVNDAQSILEGVYLFFGQRNGDLAKEVLNDPKLTFDQKLKRLEEERGIVPDKVTFQLKISLQSPGLNSLILACFSPRSFEADDAMFDLFKNGLIGPPTAL